MHAEIERKIFGQRQCGAWRNQTFDGRIVRQRQKHRHVVQHAGFLERINEEARHVVFDAHGREHDGELDVFVQQFRLAGDLRRHAVVRQAVAGENRQFLAADKRVHQIDGRNARLDEIARIFAGVGVDRHAIHVAAFRRQRRGQTVFWTRQTVEHAAEHVLRDGNAQRFAEKTRLRVALRQIFRAAEHLHDSRCRRHVKHLPKACLAVGRRDLDQFVERDVRDVLDENQRSVDGRHASVFQAFHN